MGYQNVPTCARCGVRRNPNASVKGSFCSERCYYREQGDTALNLLAHDHRLCPSCGRRLKRVETPSDDWRHANGSQLNVALEAGGTLTREDGQQVLDLTACTDRQRVAVESVIGLQSRTEDAVDAVKEFPGASDYSRIYARGTGCTCGITRTHERDEDLQAIETATVLTNYVLRFRELEAEGQLSQRISKDQFFQAYRETADLLYALGVGVYG